MAKRLTESFKLQEKGVRRKLKKEIWEKAIPSFKNLKIDIEYKEGYEQLQLTITDILNIEERAMYSKIKNICCYGSNYLITNIQCPLCGKNIEINRHWNCFICECTEHEKKIFEIKKVSYPKRRTIKEFPEDVY